MVSRLQTIQLNCFKQTSRLETLQFVAGSAHDCKNHGFVFLCAPLHDHVFFVIHP